jgi:tetratricopeptide (TPR) repeat protein
MQKMHWFSLSLAISLGLTFSGSAQAVQMTKEEYRLLPAYCRNQGNVAPELFNPDKGEQWRNQLGRDFTHIHHYCWGLVSVTRGYRAGRTSGERRFQFGQAVQDISFSIERSSPEFVLLPEMYTKLGEAYLGLRNDRNAEMAFQKAWEKNPSYWPPYVWWSQRLLKQGKTKEALAVAEEGKKNAPDSKALDKLIADIKGGGKATQN